MIGRNDPCPCGSGKKYKKCCANKEAVTVDVVVDEEMERVLQNFYELYPKKQDFEAYHAVGAKWNEALGDKLDIELVEAIAIDYFFFEERLDIWTGYLERVLKDTIRPALKERLENWSHPSLLIGKIKEVKDDYMIVEHSDTKAFVELRREGERPIPENVHVFCFILPIDEQHHLAISSMIFFPVDYTAIFEQFFKEKTMNDSMELWKKLVENGFEGNEFTDFETEVFDRIMAYLEEQGRDAERILQLTQDFVVEKQPKARKPVAIAAGAIRFGNDHGYFEKIDTTVKAIAEYFDVSASSLNKYERELAEYAGI
ncbi:SEC-C metal-binding domain-containing protein [Kurthia sp. FSL E2-0154]|uniref:YecA family protein n=1 Tax=Kurthia sp. FSL E2-0154 TaxID=2921358 RepID=UPI0030F50E4E